MPISPSADPIKPGTWQSSQWSTSFQVIGMTGPGKSPIGKVGIKGRSAPLGADALLLGQRSGYRVNSTRGKNVKRHAEFAEQGVKNEIYQASAVEQVSSPKTCIKATKVTRMLLILSLELSCLALTNVPNVPNTNVTKNKQTKIEYMGRICWTHVYKVLQYILDKIIQYYSLWNPFFSKCRKSDLT